MQYTIELYKSDKRYKDGWRLVCKDDTKMTDINDITRFLAATFPATKGYYYEVHRTYVEKTHLLTGEKFMERYDTPYYCSPSSETYWST